MKHSYLSEALINDALESRAITEQEAQKLMQKMTSQAEIFKSISK